MLFEHSKCKKCNHLNPVYKSICEECKSYLRERVVNIDLWNTIQLIIEEPSKAFRLILFAEHKNFILILTFLIAVKNLIIARFFSVPQLGLNGVSSSFMLSLGLILIITFLLLNIFSLVQKSVYKKQKFQLRFKDIYSTTSYSFVPYLFALVFIFPVELVVLGADIFSNNPFPFQIKPLITYILIGFEFICILWSFYLIYRVNFIITSARLYSILISIALGFIWFSVLLISTKFIFII
ncbi:MAG TPA: hypothetical protein DHV28_09140 [Ignavibacteriales bacterium]|nr:hypothetical protein [Ignavibacteriales bacterium]